ncbi:MAG TPA: hypothetical protein VHL58_12035 [Thermoanaerobaculia bacterium]|nr:hypothetical protein [Thermoanaerobaculia bacterium]
MGHGFHPVPRTGQARASTEQTVIITNERLLTDEEMSMFEYWVARGEATTPLPVSSGLVKGTTKPFFLATRRLATIDLRLTDKPPRRHSAQR